ncbi:hypothetical protein [Geosporobacter ferrireducens]|nr:hypothetical protein [Geosporobacter ferrireducens]
MFSVFVISLISYLDRDNNPKK